MDPSYRAYNTHIPPYLRGQPRNIILHCLGHEEKARKVLSSKDILEADEERGIFLSVGNQVAPIPLILEKNLVNPAVHVKIGQQTTYCVNTFSFL